MSALEGDGGGDGSGSGGGSGDFPYFEAEEYWFPDF